MTRVAYVIKKLPYPENLIEACKTISLHYNDEKLAKCDELYQYDLLKEIISEKLNEREQRVIEVTVQQHLPLSFCAREFNVTNERVRQIRRRALRKICHGVELTNRENERKKTFDEHLKEIEENGPLAITIDDLDLSVRTYNCLSRGGYFKLTDILEATEEKLMSLRCFGSKSLSELVDCIHKLGLKMAWEE